MGNISSNKSVRLSNITAVNNPAYGFENKEDVTLIWLDKTIDRTRTILRELTDFVLLYTDISTCVNYIKLVENERIFLILSGSYADECLQQIHDLPQVDSIFIFCINSDKYQTILEHYRKIVNIFTDENQLVDAIRREFNDLRKQISTFSLYEKQKTTRDLSKESASFLWFQLLKDVLLRMPRTQQAKQEMINQCRQYYRGNIEELKNIDEFERTYTEQDTILWYTKQCFIYRLCNKALRTEDIELLYIFRYYIQDLCKHLSIEHEKFLSKERLVQKQLTVYRGLKLTRDELARFQSNVGSLISTNGFLSTTRNAQLALEFALKTSKRSTDIQPSLFQIQIDLDLNDLIFADISSMSVYPEEEEILFDLGCAFKIMKVEFNEDKQIWIVELNLTNESRQVVDKYFESNRREMEKGNILLVFGLLLTEMGEYHKAQIYFEKLLASNTIDDRAALFTNIGRVKFYKGLYREALKDFKTVYEIQRQEEPINYLDFARTMNNLGLIYLEEKKYDLALDYHFDVLKIYQQHSDLSEILLANNNNSIGVIYTHKRDYQKALHYLFRAMKLYEKALSTIDHPIMATNYNSIGLVFYYLKDNQQALEFCLKSLNIREQILPQTHPHIADSCNNVGLIYHHLSDYEKALNLFQRALDIYEKNFGQKIRIPICWNNIGLLYLDQHKSDEAIEFYSKALHFYSNHEEKDKYEDEIEFTLNNLGVAYEIKCEFDQALEYYQRALNLQTKNLEKYVRLANKIGTIYQKKGEFKQALTYYKNALEKSDTSPADLVASVLMSMGIIYHREHQYDSALDFYKRVLKIRKGLPAGSLIDLAWIYNNIGCLYDDLGDMDRALRYQEKAYSIRQQHLPSTHPDLATSLNNLGRIHQTIAHYSPGNIYELDRALQNYKAALHIRRKSLPNDHPDLAISYYNLALIHLDQQEYEQAYSEIQMALNIQRKKLPINHPDYEQSLKLERQILLFLHDYRKKT